MDTKTDYTISFVWDEEAKVWYSCSDDVPITLESESLDELINRVRMALPEMIALNSLKMPRNIYYTIHDNIEEERKIEEFSIKSLTFNIPSRQEDANKGSYGKVLVVAGSPGMSGAAFFASLAAYRAGAGLVRILTPEQNRMILQILLPEAIVEGFDLKNNIDNDSDIDNYKDSDGYNNSANDSDLENRIEKLLHWADVLIIGPGLSTSKSAAKLMRLCYRNLISVDGSPNLVLIDADGLNLMSIYKDLMEQFDLICEKLSVIITPHPLEMSRLSGLAPTFITENPAKEAGDFSKKHHCVTLLKGSNTVISSCDGNRILKHTLTSPALAKGGSGDVLCGCIAGIYEILKAEELRGFLGTGNGSSASSVSSVSSVFFNGLALKAACVGVAVHAEAGKLAAERFGVHGVLARETADEIGRVLDRI